LDRIFHHNPSDDFIIHLDVAARSTDSLRKYKKKTAPEDCREFWIILQHVRQMMRRKGCKKNK
jgi:hypothetical protein